MISMVPEAKVQLAVQNRPTSYADLVGQEYLRQVSAEVRRLRGQFFTPVEVADFMAQLCGMTDARQLRILDPGAGAGVLSCALCEHISASGTVREIVVDAYESDVDLAGCLEKNLSNLKSWLLQKSVALSFRIIREDFVLANAEGLAEKASLFFAKPEEEYDVVIANPPYFKLPKSDIRAQAAQTIVYGQPNIYAIFMAVAAALLKAGGEMICITPRSYTAGPYFRLFREKFFSRMQPRAVHLFDSRTETFGRDDVLQESLILKARREDGWMAANPQTLVEVSRSDNRHDLMTRETRCVPVGQILDFTGKDKVLRLLLADKDEWVLNLIRQWPGSLQRYGLEISTGPVVPFRATEFINLDGVNSQTHAPLLWMQNVSPMRVEWPVTTRSKPQHIADNKQSRYLLVKNRNYVLLRRFSAKEAERRLVAAPLLAESLAAPFVGLENHLNYIHRRKGELSEREAFGLAALLNSELIDTYFRTFNGNTQISATELRALPLPSQVLIEKLGERVMNEGSDLETIDRQVNELFGI